MAARSMKSDVCDVGDKLVFLPGQEDIESAKEALDTRGATHRLVTLPLFSAMPIAQQFEVIGPWRTDSVWRIVFATNMAETALMIPNISVVIDTGVAKMRRFDVRRGVEILTRVAVSHAQAQQRARHEWAGRVF
jgi:HrpA-like RNA helicase